MTIESFNSPPAKTIRGVRKDWEYVIGMEVHAQVTSKSKLFSGASTTFGSEPNSNVSLVDAAMPGMLPVLNKFCVEQTVKTGLGLNAQINLESRFDRKNYFYPDLPQGYQISQLYEPLVGGGEVYINLDNKFRRRIRIERIHLEQDAGKSIHDLHPKHSFVDLNRTGVALMEIVSKPDIRGPEEAAEYLKNLRKILRYLGTCDGNMQEGSLRADVNVSVCEPGTYEKFNDSGDLSYLGTRCEIKNLNSMRFVQQAIETEARRQIELLEMGKKVVQETRLFDPEKNETRSMRSKEEAHDYRYFPCPDLLPLKIEEEWVNKIRKSLPELPDKKFKRFIDDYGVTAYDASVLTSEISYANFFEKVAQKRDGKTAANWVINELFGRLNKEGKSLSSSPINAEQIGEIIDLITSEKISGKIGKELFEIVWVEGGKPNEIVIQKNLLQMSNAAEIEEVVRSVVRDNPQQVAKLRENPKLLGWFVGQVMKKTNGKANPTRVNQFLREKLNVDKDPS
ncbi:MAG: Asp-tRNA(Asn)/Glu-tRNA(Gln) amidotransferase subunit GatB [Pseudomonadota bacterium]|nr:Asp-tRNA(Asn)/Glu-tRNA(Gln) amidotransferase subunit GatB [Pseudomonadota bacterium]